MIDDTYAGRARGRITIHSSARAAAVVDTSYVLYVHVTVCDPRGEWQSFGPRLPELPYFNMRSQRARGPVAAPHCASIQNRRAICQNVCLPACGFSLSCRVAPRRGSGVHRVRPIDFLITSNLLRTPDASQLAGALAF